VVFKYSKELVFKVKKPIWLLIGLALLLNVLKISHNGYLKSFTAEIGESAPQVAWRARLVTSACHLSDY
jgi:hypothetical protein